MDSNVNIAGLSEIQAWLDMLPEAVEKKLMRGALRAGQKVIADTARQNAPLSPPSAENAANWGGYAGALRDSIRVGTRVRNGRIVAYAKAGNKTAFYAKMVEYGTAAHVIPGPVALGGHVYTHLDHPGAQKRPYMRPAMDANVSESSPAFTAIKDYLQGKIVKELDKLPDDTQDGIAP